MPGKRPFKRSNKSRKTSSNSLRTSSSSSLSSSTINSLAGTSTNTSMQQLQSTSSAKLTIDTKTSTTSNKSFCSSSSVLNRQYQLSYGTSLTDYLSDTTLETQIITPAKSKTGKVDLGKSVESQTIEENDSITDTIEQIKKKKIGFVSPVNEESPDDEEVAKRHTQYTVDYHEMGQRFSPSVLAEIYDDEFFNYADRHPGLPNISDLKEGVFSCLLTGLFIALLIMTSYFIIFLIEPIADAMDLMHHLFYNITKLIIGTQQRHHHHPNY